MILKFNATVNKILPMIIESFPQKTAANNVNPWAYIIK